MSFRTWVTVITLILLAVVVYFGWPEIVQAWQLLGKTDLWILALLIPVQFFSYYATGGMIFSYLRSKGNLKTTTHWQMTRMALELNFVNHILPSGGAAGFSYLGWVLHRHGVSAGRATISQIIRFALTFITFLLLLVVSVVVLALDHQINRTILLLCIGIAVLALGSTFGIIFIINNKARLLRFSGWLTRTSNRCVAFVTRGKKPEVIKSGIIETFFEELHQDYVEVRREKKILLVPFVWALLANLADVALLYISFWALGVSVNPAVLFIAFGLSSIGSVFSVTPGGAGVYEAIFITFLASTGVPADIAIAGTLLARVTLLLGTIVFGYLFYQLTVNKYGKSPTQR
jgi:putative heme transporter